MPLYVYTCKKCSAVSTKIRSVDDRENPIVCSECGGEASYTATYETQPPIFKGTGFYETDYKGKK